MATTKTTRSPRRAQPNSKSGLPRKRYRLTKPVERLPVYENLFALNRGFEEVLIALARLQELGAIQRDFGHIFSIMVKKTRAEANMDITYFLQEREQDAGAWYDRLHRWWERRMRDPNDVLREAKLVMAKRRKAAARKKRKQQGRGAGSKAV
jgi:hypothetical protein